MTTPFATMTMSRSGYSTNLTDQGKALPPGNYVLLAVPVAEPTTDHHRLAERISLLMTFADATLTEYQQNVLASALMVLQVEAPNA